MEDSSKVEIKIKESEKLKEIIKQFCELKMEIYGYSYDEWISRVEKFLKNIETVSFNPKVRRKNPEKLGAYYAMKKEIVLYYEFEQTMNPDALQILLHELNHAWNYRPDKDQIGVIEFSDRKSMDRATLRKTRILNETINEAEAQLMVSSKLKNSSKIYNKQDGEYLGYPHYESLFETLCIICNQNGKDFLKSVEGKTADEIIKHISNISGTDFDDTKFYIDTVLDMYNSLNEKKKKYVKEGQKKQDRRLTIRQKYCEAQDIYNLSQIFIDRTKFSPEEKIAMFAKLECIQPKFSARFLGRPEREYDKLVDTGYRTKYLMEDSKNLFDYGKQAWLFAFDGDRYKKNWCSKESRRSVIKQGLSKFGIDIDEI